MSRTHGLALFRTLSTCHERPPPVHSESDPSWQVAAGYRDINTAKTVVGTLQKWSTKAGGHSPKGPAVAGTSTYRLYIYIFIVCLHINKYVLNC